MMEGQISLFEYVKEKVQPKEKYFYVVGKKGFKTPCCNCDNWEFSFKGARCEFTDCYENGCKDFKDMLKGGD